MTLPNGNAMASEVVLSPIEARLLVAIADDPGATQADLGAELKISARHVRRLMAREPVRRALDAAARAGLDAGAALLGRGATRAAHALVAMSHGTTKATTARVAACKAVLEGAGRLINLVDLERRIEGLERTSRGPRPGNGELQ